MLKIVEDEIKSIAIRVISMSNANAERDDASDNPYFVAWEILDLTDWMCNEHSTNHFIIKEILKSDKISEKIKQIVRQLS